jgi:large subunit ribosomal protein L13
MGKHKPIWDPSTDCGDYVVVTGCNDLFVTGNKMQQKKYYSHSTRPGSLKTITMEKMMAKWGGGEILRRAVRGMLPKNRLRDDRMARLKCACCDAVRRCSVVQVIDSLPGFESKAHPYKQNLIKLEDTQSAVETTEVNDTPSDAPQAVSTQ